MCLLSELFGRRKAQLSTSRLAACPYCGKQLGADATKEHVFPQFLGGRRTTAACTACNNSIGTQVEGVVWRENFLPNILFLRAMGLSPNEVPRRWAQAYEHDGRTYDLVPSPRGVRPELSKPFFERNAEGEIVAAEFKTETEASHFARKKEAQGLKVMSSQGDPPTIPPRITRYWSSSDALFRMVLKIGIAGASLLEGYTPERFLPAAGLLARNTIADEQVVLHQFTDVPELDSQRRPLSHLLYVECSKRRAYAVAQFFGAFQYFALLSDERGAGRPAALLATLDPLDGAETFDVWEPLDLAQPPEMLDRSEPEAPFRHWLEKFTREAAARGATCGPTELVKVE